MRFAKLLKLVLASALLMICANAASAQVVNFNGYYEEYKNVSCTAGGNSSCGLVFTAMTGYVMITDVSCLFTVNQPPAQTGFGVADSTAGAPLRRIEYFPAQIGNTQLGNTFYSAKFKTFFLFGPGKYPTIYVNMITVGTAQITCKIAGTNYPSS